MALLLAWSSVIFTAQCPTRLQLGGCSSLSNRDTSTKPCCQHKSYSLGCLGCMALCVPFSHVSPVLIGTADSKLTWCVMISEQSHPYQALSYDHLDSQLAVWVLGAMERGTADTNVQHNYPSPRPCCNEYSPSRPRLLMVRPDALCLREP